MHGESASLTPAAGAITVFSPRPMNSSAQTFCISWQTSAQRPHLMHLSGLSTIDGVDLSTSWWTTSFGKGFSRMPKSAAIAWSSQLPERGHCRQSFGWLARMSSSTVLRTCTMSGSWVMIFIPGVASVQQARSSLGLGTNLPLSAGLRLGTSCLTTQMPQLAPGLRSGW